MESADILKNIRRGIREPKPKTISDAEINKTILRAVSVLSLYIKERSPSFYAGRVSLTSYTHAFAWPSDCTSILNVWDMDTNANDITGTADSGGIVSITSVDHGFSTGDVVLQHDIAGTTEANDTFQVTVVDDDTYTLDGSTYANAYVSGGKAFQEIDTFYSIDRRIISDASLANDTKWYPREKNIIIDDPTFGNDLIIDYLQRPSAITDIPAEYHEGLVSWPVFTLIRLPKPESQNYYDFLSSKKHHQAVWQMVLEDIERTLRATSEPSYIKDVWND